MENGEDLLAQKLAEEERRRLNDRLKTLTQEKENLRVKFEEQNESYARVAERLSQTKNEIRSREEEMGDVQSKIDAEEEKTCALFGLDGDVSKVGPEMGRDEDDLDAETALKALKLKLGEIGAKLGVRSVEEGGVIEDGDGKFSPDAIHSVFVEFRTDVCGFRLTPNTTFLDLTKDVCRYWGVEPLNATLRDDENIVWPQHGLVRDVLVGEINRYDQGAVSLPKLRLIGSVSEKGAIGDMTENAANSNVKSEEEFFQRLLEKEELARRSQLKSRHAGRAWRARQELLQGLSSIFHGPQEQAVRLEEIHYKTAKELASRDKGRYRGSEQDVERVAKFTGICFNLLLWLVFVVCLLVASSYRHSVGVSYAMAYSLQQGVMGEFPAVPPAKFANDTVRVLNQHLSGGVDPTTLGTLRVFRAYPFCQIQDSWSFYEHVFAQMFFPAPSHVFDSLVSANASIAKLLGPVHIRQSRVQSDSCTLNPVYSGMLVQPVCYDRFSAKSESTATFGGTAAPTPSPANITAIVNEAFKYSDQGRLAKSVTEGTFSYYPDRGFYLDLPQNLSNPEYLEVLNQLQSRGWLDRATRAITTQVMFTNANINVVIVMSILIEISSTGGVLTRVDFDFAPENYYDVSVKASVNSFIIASDVLCGLYVNYLLYLTVIDVIVYGFLRAASTIWNTVQIVVWLTFMVALVCRVYYEFSVKNISLTNAEDSLSLHKTITGLELCCNFFSVLVVFGFVQGNRKVSAIFETTARSLRFIGTALFALFLLLCGFWVAGTLVYGPKLAAWATLLRSLQSVYGFLQNDVNYVSLKFADNVFTPFYFMFYTLVYTFIFISLITGVYMNAYFEVAATGLPRAKPRRFWTSILTAPFKMVLDRNKWRGEHKYEHEKKD
mmetsp:Transcript_9285/g.15093  ORF Transcript_9285/g.15093 Transcript_9285/m.15093 type:complete len:889 (-) Transcript_9285:1397-4063(-)|eukprot:CAMPEP_0203759180 /NCGR_PEP_ID=MMETSP0098-20131031/12144_1 /ASSEMBLY_ACC=CAM_ASM_000208 /TAXON_ID=96639 /ORGANISM=" , Strain NY0313808BC1" /LENGTH=888 /DNA_ID=CAMNT_0050651983 /DNA_START=178 /DNA_END=2844 /DNA_ORIENTATION=-